MNQPDHSQDRQLWKFSGHAGPLGAGIDVQVPYYPGLLSEILKAEIIDPLTLLLQKVLHVSDFVDAPAGDLGGHFQSSAEVSVRRLRTTLGTAKVGKQTTPLRVTGVFSTAVLLSYGWWERTGPSSGPVGRNDIQRWTYAGFEEWAPSWDFTSDAGGGNEPFFLGQIGHGDEANSILVVVLGERARAIRSGIVGLMHERKVAALPVEITGLLCHRTQLRKHNPQLAVIAERWHRDFNYCLLLDADHHHITPIHEVPDYYSAYLWKCLWAKEKAPAGLPRLNDCYLIWEHTDLTKPSVVDYNLDSLRHKEEYLTKRYGAMDLLQKSGPLIEEETSLPNGSFRDLFGAISRM